MFVDMFHVVEESVISTLRNSKLCILFRQRFGEYMTNGRSTVTN